MERLESMLERSRDAISRRQQATSAILASWNSDPQWQPDCSTCKRPEGLLREEYEGLIVVLVCPRREDTERCALARIDRAKAAEEKSRWLRAHGVMSLYHGMTLERVDPQAREHVAGYLTRLRQHVAAGHGLLLTGTTGAGKTAILGLIAECAYAIGLRSVEFVYSYDLYAAFCRKDEEAREQVKRWRECALLLLDEFGATYSHDFPASEFEGFCEHRQADRLATCITTNIAIKAMKSSPEWSRIYDRWRSTCWGLELTNPSKRESLPGAP